jgi:parvulin-like peptidyl-prolyl isomerase
MRILATSILLLLLASGCNNDKAKGGGSAAGGAGPAGTGSGSAGAEDGRGAGGAAAPGDVDSKDVLARTQVAREAYVRYALITWQGRDRDAAAKLAQEVLAQVRAQPDAIDALIEQHSADPASKTGDPRRVEPGGPEPAPLLQLALRLAVGEAGIATTDQGFHVVLRVAKPPADPLESTDILKREEETPPVYRQQIVIGWDQRPANPDPRARARTKEAADALAKELLAKVRGNADMKQLMKEHSEDPRTKDSGRVEVVTAGATEPADRLAIRMKMDEAGLVRSALGWHVVKRVAAPPVAPDKLESHAILRRAPQTDATKVKHILLGWDEVNAGDPRGEARSRAALEKLVAEILAKVKRGEPFESLMTAHSEDVPEMVASGKPYDVAPDAGLALPFVNLGLRLKVGEVGVVRTEFGIHIVKRVE